MSRRDIDQVVTHSGTFHPDDVFAFAVLKEVFRNPALVRSRDPRVTCGGPGVIVFDVGGVYDPARLIFDHHQRDKALREDGTPYSSFGLIWKEYGRDYLRLHVSDEMLEEIWNRLDQTIVLRVDRVDNGLLEPEALDIIGIIDDFNPAWCEEQKGFRQDQKFDDAAAFAAGVLGRLIEKENAHIIARDHVRKAAAEAEDPAIIVLPASMPFEDVVLKEFPEARFAVYPNREKTEWLCLAIPPEKGSFAQKMPLPEAWAGIRDAALAEVTGVPTALFAHPGRFICGATAREGAIELARRAYEIGMAAEMALAPGR